MHEYKLMNHEFSSNGCWIFKGGCNMAAGLRPLAALGLTGAMLLIGTVPPAAAQVNAAQQKTQEVERARANPAQKAPPPREPWQWTLDERLAVRFDPEDMRRRAEERLADLADFPGATYEEGVCIVNGARDPALLLPFELYNKLLILGFGSKTELWQEDRQEILREAKSLGFGEDFWTTLQTLAREQLQLRETRRQEAKQSGGQQPAPSVEEQKAECAKRLETLTAFRAHFGKRFDEFLYRAVAPRTNVAMPPNPDWPQQLRLIEGGCQ
jgi:hypothetical protein